MRCICGKLMEKSDPKTYSCACGLEFRRRPDGTVYSPTPFSETARAEREKFRQAMGKIYHLDLA